VIDFKPSPGASIGIEIEFQLIDPATFDLVDGILPIMKFYPNNPYIQPEFNQSTVEINSRICSDINELERDVYTIVTTLKRTCTSLGMVLSGGGTHPFCSRPATATPLPRYLAMEEGDYLAQTFMVYAMHVHVGLSSGEETISVMRNLRPYLPVLMALSASSPFWWGHDSGYACYRQRVLAALRSYGLPLYFQDWKAFSDFYESARRAGVFRNFDDIHWDIRPRPDMGTLELRVMDTQSSIREAIVLASFVHVLVEFLREKRSPGEAGGPLGSVPYWVEKENYFRASRRGMEAIVIEDERGETRPLRSVIEDVIFAVENTASRIGEGEKLKLLEKFIESGPSYRRQRRIFQETGSLKEVVAFQVRELEQDFASHKHNTVCPD
jgi:carboxylate-amine ligase